MGRAITLSILCSLIVYGCSSISPEEERDAAFQKYSQYCVARGIPEDTPEHTRCVLSRYEAYKNEQERAANKMTELYADKPDATAQPTETNKSE